MTDNNIEMVKTEKRRPIRKPDVLVAARPTNDADKPAPQAKVIYDTIARAGASGVTKEQLLLTLEYEGNLKTRQTVDRVFVWYIDELIVNGLVEVRYAEKAEKPANEDGTEKPKRKKKAAAAEAPAEGEQAAA